MAKLDFARYEHDRHAFRREQLVLPNGKRLGEIEEPWQTEGVFKPLDAKGEDGEPLYKLLYFELPRGHAKTAALAAEALTSAFLDGDIRVYFAAGDQGQARIAFEMLTGFLRRNSELAKSFRVLRDSVEVKATGARIEVLASDAPTVYGLGGLSEKLLICCDELWVWPDRRLFDALFSATAKAQSWRVLVASNAGFDSTSLAFEVREQCRTQADPQFYLFSPDGVQASWIKPKDLETQRRSLPPDVYQRLYENRWTEGASSLITRPELEACIDPFWRPQLEGSGFDYHVGLDLGLTRDRTARAIVHFDRQSNQVVLDALRVWEGSRSSPVQIAEVERDLLEVNQRFRRSRFRLDPWQLAGSQQRLQGKLDISEFKFSGESVRRLSESLLSLIKAKQLKLFPDPELERELLRLEAKQTSYGWRLDHRAGGYSDRAIAVAIAALAAVENIQRSVAVFTADFSPDDESDPDNAPEDIANMMRGQGLTRREAERHYAKLHGHAYVEPPPDDLEEMGMPYVG
jgi:terminase large subunit-like protein